MRSSFDTALSRILAHEGGFSDHPADPGGATYKGVTQRTYDAYRKAHSLPKSSVRYATDAEIYNIYRDSYWRTIQGDALPAGVDYVVFDGAVNSGPTQSVKWLQRALAVKDDGFMGPVTLSALASTANHDAVIESICDQRLAFMRKLKGWKTFGAGWSRRVSEVMSAGQSMARGAYVTADGIGETGAAKADPVDRVEVSTKRADAVTGAGVGIAAVSQSLDGLKYELGGFAGTHEWVDRAILAVTILSAAVAVAGIFWRIRQDRRAREINEATR